MLFINLHTDADLTNTGVCCWRTAVHCAGCCPPPPLVVPLGTCTFSSTGAALLEPVLEDWMVVGTGVWPWTVGAWAGVVVIVTCCPWLLTNTEEDWLLNWLRAGGAWLVDVDCFVCRIIPWGICVRYRGRRWKMKSKNYMRRVGKHTFLLDIALPGIYQNFKPWECRK